MLLYWSTWIVVRLLARVLFRLKIAGQEHLPKTGGVIVASNHASYLDIPILGCGMSRQAWFLGRMDLFHGPVGMVMRMLGWIPMRRERVDRKGFEEAVRRLKAGQAVVIYPEGGRSEDGQLKPGKPGVGLLVASTGCPVVPARLDGTYEALPPGARWIRMRPIRVTFGPPVDFSTWLRDDALESETNKKALYQKIGQEIMDRIAELGRRQMSSRHSLQGAQCS
jgi:1-acyl-sn-glycerol-3-phosphate acyltransferase